MSLLQHKSAPGRRPPSCHLGSGHGPTLPSLERAARIVPAQALPSGANQDSTMHQRWRGRGTGLGVRALDRRLARLSPSQSPRLPIYKIGATAPLASPQVKRERG